MKMLRDLGAAVTAIGLHFGPIHDSWLACLFVTVPGIAMYVSGRDV